MTLNRPRGLAPDLLAAGIPALVGFVLHLSVITGYGLGGDELVAIACSDHPAPGYVERGPVPVLLLALVRLIAGDTPLALRFLPALVSSLTIWFTARIARRMGAGAAGQLLAALCALIAPSFLAAGHVMTPLVFGLFAWTVASLLIVRLVEESTPVRWLLLGLTVGIGMLTLFSVAILPAALLAGLLLTSRRRLLMTPWPWAGAGIGLLTLVPWMIWQASHGWPTVEWIVILRADAMQEPPAQLLPVLWEVVKLLHPLSAPVWAGGLAALFIHPHLRQWRAAGWMSVAAVAVMLIAGLASHLVIPAAPLLFAAGGTAVGGWLRRRWMHVAVVLVLIAGGILTAPMGVPVLAPRTFIAYEQMTGMRMTMGSPECDGRLPGYYGTMFGRKELAVVLNAVFATLPPPERERFGILCASDEQAAALNFHGGSFGLPRAISPNNSHWYFGTAGYSGSRLVVVGGEAAALQSLFADVVMRMRFRDEYLHPGNGMTPVFLVARPAVPLESMWGELKDFR